MKMEQAIKNQIAKVEKTLEDRLAEKAPSNTIESVQARVQDLKDQLKSAQDNDL